MNDLLTRTMNLKEDDMSKNAWIGVDLDGTLAHYDEWKGSGFIGEPIPDMVERVKRWVAKGRQVRIFTARVSQPDYNPQVIIDWLVKVGIGPLPITNVKDMYMIELWDDRAVQVEKNTGRRIG